MTVQRWQFEMSGVEPEWGYWESVPWATCEELCGIALNVNPEDSREMLRRVKDEAKPTNSWDAARVDKVASSQPSSEVERLYCVEYDRLFSIVGRNLVASECGDKQSRRSLGNARIEIIEFVRLADSLSIALPEKFPRDGVKLKPDTTKDLEQAYKVIAELLDSVKDSRGSVIKQGAIAREIADRKVGLGFRILNGIFSESRKVQEK